MTKIVCGYNFSRDVVVLLLAANVMDCDTTFYFRKLLVGRKRYTESRFAEAVIPKIMHNSGKSSVARLLSLVIYRPPSW